MYRLLAIVMLLAALGPLAALEQAEQHAIDALIVWVTKQPDTVRFIRNGSDYATSDAVKLMRNKWDSQKDAVQTADDFIQLCASRSEHSGKRYRIRLADGSERDSSEVLREQLTFIRAAAAAKP